MMQIFVRRKNPPICLPRLWRFYCLRLLTATILFFDFAGTALYLPLVRPEALTNLYGISNRSLMAHLFYHKPLQYTVIYIIMDALLVGAWEIIALAVSVATRNPLQPALFPFLLYLLLYFICNWLQMDSVSLFAILLPFQPAVNVKWVTIAIYFLAVPIGSMTMYFLKRNKSDVL
ncbi:hypothetical protein NIA69_06400 [Gemmiger formicilis]|nr:hypothetical protein [Gemmiger formicilis]